MTFYHQATHDLLCTLVSATLITSEEPDVSIELMRNYIHLVSLQERGAFCDDKDSIEMCRNGHSRRRTHRGGIILREDTSRYFLAI